GAENLAARGVKALVVACNTATAAAVESLRQSFAFPIIGMEPAVKPACEELHGQTIAVMATEATLRLNKFRQLAGKYVHTNTIVPLPCRGLSRLVETAGPGSPEMIAYLTQLFAGLPAPPAGIVIGCTHYSFILGDIRGILPRAHIFDGADGTARQLQQILAHSTLLNPNTGAGRVAFLSTPGWEAQIPLFEDFYQMKLEEPERSYA
ncbi:MAG: aspartate/glutamate racemase family protein, partial [Eubacteriales bacterium]|nr:aspartate/glutamate racemase family protein [Eubacteriales bacterium]